MATETSKANRETWQYLQDKSDGRFAITVVMENGVVTSHTKAPAR
jgi:hypothetical protein